MSTSNGVLGLFLIGGLTVVFGLSGCGGSNGPTQEDIDRARAEGAKEARDQAKVSRLQRQVNQLRRQQKRANASSANTTAAPTPPPAPTMSPARYCDAGIGVSSVTTCGFALNVSQEWRSNPGASIVQAWSPTTGRYYDMRCVAMSGWSAVCTGGTNAAVFIP